MTLYSSDSYEKVTPAPTVTKIYNLMTWDEMDRIRIGGPRYYTLTITGVSGAPATGYGYTVNGKPVTSTDAYYLMRSAQTTGTVELVA